MLQPNPEKGSLPEITHKIVRKAELIGARTIEVSSTNNLRATATLLIASTALGAYWTDVHNNQEIRANASIEITVAAPAKDPANSHNAILLLNGFGESNADSLVKTMGPMVQEITDGDILDVSYGNAPLDEEVIVNKTIDVAEEEGYTDITVAGYSTGGIIAIDITPALMAAHGPQVQQIVPISTPDGVPGLRKHPQAEIAVAKFIDKIPGAKYSTPVRFLGELYFRRDKYAKGDLGTRLANFFKTIADVRKDMGRKDMAGTWLLIDQVFAIADADLDSDYKNIGKQAETMQMPVTTYFGSKLIKIKNVRASERGYDYEVDNFRSSKNICGYAGSIRLTDSTNCFTFNVPGAVHTRPDMAHPAYMQTAKNAAPQVKAAIEKAKLYYSTMHVRIPTKVPR